MIEGVRGSRDAYDITEYSYIKDAEYGVFAAKDSRLNIELSYFDKNLHHIWLENYRFALDRKISFCDFDKTGTMLLYTAPVSPPAALCSKLAGHGGIQCYHFFDHSSYLHPALSE